MKFFVNETYIGLVGTKLLACERLNKNTTHIDMYTKLRLRLVLYVLMLIYQN